jgi:polar amino acid transport system permease protein/octopine/nopaline transport system permease protein
MLDLHGYGWQLLEGAGMTLRVAGAVLAPGLALGLAGAFAKLSRFRPARALAEAYTTVIRGVPELVILLLFYFGGTVLLTRLSERLGGGYLEVDAFTAGVVALSLVFGGYATEVFRAAIRAVPTGEIEAARAVGMSRGLLFRRIVLPQVWRYALPGLGNIWLVLLKDTALVSVVGLDELMRKTYVGAGSTRDPLPFYVTAALVYLGLTIVSTAALQAFERHVTRAVRAA